MRRDTHDVDVIFLQANLELEFFQISPVVMMIGFHLHSCHLFHPHPSCKAKLVPQMQAPIHQKSQKQARVILKTVINGSLIHSYDDSALETKLFA